MRICPICFERFANGFDTCYSDGQRLLDISDDDPRCGSVLAGRFLLLDRLAEGGMGIVYRAYQLSLRRVVALKLLPGRHARRGSLVKRFMREAHALGALRSPHSVSCFDYGDLATGEFYIAMELLEGRSLADLIAAEGPLPLDRTLSILQQVCLALEDIHSAGYVHRDVKPQNIIVERQGDEDFIKLVDFGLVKDLDPTGGRITRTGEMLGSPAYLSPEQVSGGDVGPAADLYAMGIMAFEMLTNRLPFESENVFALLSMHVHNDPPRVRDYAPDEFEALPLEGIVTRLLRKNPENRYASAEDLRHELARIRAPGIGQTGIGQTGFGQAGFGQAGFRPILVMPLPSRAPFSLADSLRETLVDIDRPVTPLRMWSRIPLLITQRSVMVGLGVATFLVGLLLGAIVATPLSWTQTVSWSTSRGETAATAITAAREPLRDESKEPPFALPGTLDVRRALGAHRAPDGSVNDERWWVPRAFPFRSPWWRGDDSEPFDAKADADRLSSRLPGADSPRGRDAVAALRPRRAARVAR